jgi:hypothetical protein
MLINAIRILFATTVISALTLIFALAYSLPMLIVVLLIWFLWK